MSRNTTAQPGPVAHGICVVLCLLLTLCLLVTGLALPAVRLLTDRDFDLSVAQDTAVVDAQYARIGEKIDALAAQYGFEPKTVMDLVTRERLLDYHAQMVDWLLNLTQPDAVYTAPSFEVEGLVDAIKEDETFQESTPSASRTSVARDKIAVKVCSIVEEAAVPLRLSLISLALGKVLPQLEVSRYAAYLPYVRWALAAVLLILMGLMALVMHKRTAKSLLYIGSGCAAGGLLLLIVGVLIAYANLSAGAAAYSALLGMQLRTLLNALGRPYFAKAVILLAAGLVLIGVHQHRMKALYTAQEAA